MILRVLLTAAERDGDCKAGVQSVGVRAGWTASDYNYVRPFGHCMYRQFNIQEFYVLPTQCIYVFYVDLRTNSDFPI